MKKKMVLFFWTTMICFAMAACVTQGPPGSKKIQSFRGSYSGEQTEGDCQIDFFAMPDGSTSFEGTFIADNQPGTVYLKGTVSGNRLTGTLGPETGTLSGTLSPNGNKIAGSYDMTNLTYKGTFEVTRVP